MDKAIQKHVVVRVQDRKELCLSEISVNFVFICIYSEISGFFSNVDVS